MIEPSETLDIAQAMERWDELLDRCQAGEAFILTGGDGLAAHLAPITNLPSAEGE